MEICPFVSGRALKPAEFHDRQAELQRVLDRLVTSQSTAIIGQPHSGKTSFLNYLLDQTARRQIIGNHLDQSIFAYINSQNLGNSFDQSAFWKQVLTPLIAQFQAGAIFETYTIAEKNQFGAFMLEQLFRVVEREGWQFVLLIDEFDALLSHAILNSAEFFGGLRSLASGGAGFALVIASRHAIDWLNQETQKINPHGSPYFNVFTELRLGTLPVEIAKNILNQAQGKLGNLDRQFIQKVSGYQPYLLQTAADILWNLHEQGKRGPDRYQCAAEDIYRQTEAHFDDTWDSRSDAEKKVLTAIALAQIPELVEQHDFAWDTLIEDITDYNSELRKLQDAGTIIETRKNAWQMTQQAFIWWLADEIKRMTRDETSFKDWLCKHEIDGLFTKKECEKMGQAAKKVSGLLGKGATTLIESFAKGFGEAIGKATAA